MTWTRWALAPLFVLDLALHGCQNLPTAEAPKELTTASDQTDAERRARGRLELASAYFGRGQTAVALDEVKVALASNPNYAEAFNLRGLIYASMGESALATENFKRALQLKPNDADTLHNFAWFHCQEKRYGQADALFEQALAQPQYRDTTRTLLTQGVCQARAGQLAQAERTLTRSYELDPSNPATAVNLTDLLIRRGEYERARFYIRRVNGVNELANAQTLWLAALIEQRLGNSAGAREFGKQLTQRFPQSPEALRFERGQFDDQ